MGVVMGLSSFSVSKKIYVQLIVEEKLKVRSALKVFGLLEI